MADLHAAMITPDRWRKAVWRLLDRTDWNYTSTTPAVSSHQHGMRTMPVFAVVVLTLVASACSQPGGLPPLGGDGSAGGDGGGADRTSDGPGVESRADVTWEECGLVLATASEVPGTSCTFLVPEPSSGVHSRASIDVLLNDELLPMSDDDGWVYLDPEQRTFALVGPPCDRYLANPAAVVAVMFRCLGV